MKFAIVLICTGIILLITAVAQAAQNRSYSACSETVLAKVVRKQSRNVKNGKSYELTVSYMVNGVSYEKVVGALLSEYNAIYEGDSLELLYNPDNPKKAVRPTVLKSQNVRILLIFSAVLIVGGIIVFFIGRI